MIRNYLQSIEEIDIFPIISLLIFVLFFAVLIIWLVKVDKNYLKEMKELPLEQTKNGKSILTGDKNDK